MAKSRSWGQRHLERRQLTYSTANLRRVQLAWGSAGELVSTTYPSQRVVTYGYAEDKERPDSVTVSGFSGNIVGGVKYNPDNTVKTMDWNNNTARRHTLARDLRGRVTGIQSLLTASTKLTDVHYDYNSNGDVDDEWETGLVAASKTWLRRDGAAVADNARPYGYQTGHDRLQSWTDDTVGESVSYVAGRRSAQVSGGQTFIDSYGSSSPRVEQLTAHTATGEHTRSMTLAYDAGGRVSVINAGNDADATNDVTFGYGPLGNVVTTTVNSGTSTSRYDAQMRRTKLVLPTGSTRTWFYAGGRNAIEQTLIIGTSTWRYEDIYLAGQPLAQVATNFDGSLALYHLHSDRMGVARKVFTPAGTLVGRVVMDPFGGTNAASSPVVWEGTPPVPAPVLLARYPGQVDDGNGLVNNGWRVYLPELGQFTSPEPLHAETLARGFYGPQAYAYAAAAPATFVDPDGRSVMRPPQASPPTEPDDEMSLVPEPGEPAGNPGDDMCSIEPAIPVCGYYAGSPPICTYECRAWVGPSTYYECNIKAIIGGCPRTVDVGQGTYECRPIERNPY